MTGLVQNITLFVLSMNRAKTIVLLKIQKHFFLLLFFIKQKTQLIGPTKSQKVMSKKTPLYGWQKCPTAPSQNLNKNV